MKIAKTAFPVLLMRLGLATLPLLPPDSPAAPPAMAVGQCVTTTVVRVGTRLVATPGSGTAIQFANGIALVSYDTVPPAEASKPGDPVRMCLKSVPRNCPPGDDRGKVYTVTNLKTHQSFTLPDSQHECGGA